MLVTTKEMLLKAQKGNYAVGAFNVENMEMVMAVIAAAEELNAPVIMQTTPSTVKYAGLDYYLANVATAAKNAKVPVAMHLDHGSSFSLAMQALRQGYTSIMIDGSHSVFEENIAITKSVVDACKPSNIPVEAELGKVGGKEDDLDGGDGGYTDPKEALEFVQKTGVNSLAVAIGTAHGIYPSDMKPELRLDILQILKDTLDIPLVLHGGSSNKDEEIAKAVKIGISKINISSDIKVAFYDKCREVLNAHPEYREPLEIYPEPIKACREVIAHKVNLFDSADKVKYYYE